MSQLWKTSEEAENVEGTPAGGAEQTTQEGAGEESSKAVSLNTGTLALFAVFLGGLAMIYFLGLQAKPRAASAEQTQTDAQMDSALAELTGKKPEELRAMFKDTDRMLQMFRDYPGPNPFPAEKLPPNPFEHGAPVQVQASGVVVGGNDMDAAERAHLQKLADAFASLKLQTVLYSKRSPAALINNNLVTVGSHVGAFTVAQIKPQVVVLKAGPNRYELKLSSDQ